MVTPAASWTVPATCLAIPLERRSPARRIGGVLKQTGSETGTASKQNHTKVK